MNIMITSYENPDLDGFACAIAYAELLKNQGKDAYAVIFGTPHFEAQFVIQKLGIEYPLQTNFQKGDQVVLLDASRVNTLPSPCKPSDVIEIIDHRTINEKEKFPNAKIQIELVGSCATLIAEKFKASNIRISKQSAILLYGAITSNTLNFQANVTTNRDRAMAIWLSEQTTIPDNFVHEMLSAKSDLAGGKLEKTIRGDFVELVYAGKKIGIAQIEMIGAAVLVAKRKDEIVNILASIKEEKQLNYIFISLIDLEGKRNIFIANEKEMQNILEDVLNISFKENLAIRDGLIMRKEITPKIKEYFKDK